MIRTVVRLVAVAALATSTLAVAGGSQLASGQTGPVGYTMGSQTRGFLLCDFYEVDLGTGAAEAVNADPLPCADGLTFSPDGTLYGYRNVPAGGIVPAELVTIDPATGAQTLVGELPPVFAGSGGMTFDGDGNLWLYAQDSGVGASDCVTDFDVCLWQVDPTDASSTFVGVAPTGVGVFGLAGTCDEVIAISTPVATGPAPSQTTLEVVDTTTAGLTELVAVPDVVVPEGLDYDAEGQLWSLSQGLLNGFFSDVFVNQIDPATGAATTTPVTVGGDQLEAAMFGLAIAGITCEVPVPPAPDVIVVTPTFTG